MIRQEGKSFEKIKENHHPESRRSLFLVKSSSSSSKLVYEIRRLTSTPADENRLKQRHSSCRHCQQVNSSALNTKENHHMSCWTEVQAAGYRKVTSPREKGTSSRRQLHHHQQRWQQQQQYKWPTSLAFLFTFTWSSWPFKKSTRNIVILFMIFLLLLNLTHNHSCQEVVVKEGENINENSATSALPKSSSTLTRKAEEREENLRSTRRVNSIGKSVTELHKVDPIIQTKHGLFRGIYLTSTSSDSESDQAVIGFFGIRYASAPVKRLRFMPPSPYHYAPNQVYNMQSFGPICWQRWPINVNALPSEMEATNLSPSEVFAATTSSNLSGASQDSQQLESLDFPSLLSSSSLEFKRNDSTYLRGSFKGKRQESDLARQLRLMKGLMSRESFAQFRPIYEELSSSERVESEDCLNLNIYMPSQAIPGKSELAVLVIIHGDSFDFGAGSSIDASSFVQANELIVITFNFRLNILGFPPKLAGASRGNLGLMDQVAALHWIKDNIDSFGGSPNNITLMGSKKGAIFVNLLALSPMAKGLFQRAVMQDGSALSPLVANHVSGASSTWLSQQASSHINSLAIQHVRVLAKLCDCPAHTDQFARQQQPLDHPTSAGVSLFLSENSTTSNPQPLASSPSTASEEATKNALTFECLRHKPIELLLLQIPLHLIRTNPSSGQLFLDSDHLQESSLSSVSAQTTGPRAPNQQPLTAQSTSTELLATLSKLFLQAHSEQLAAVRTGHNSQLFTALYPSVENPPSALRPLFGPTIDGAVVPANGEDLAELMLKRASPFAQRDLLVGLSQPLSLPEAPVAKLLEEEDDKQPESAVELQPSHLMAELISRQLQQDGLSSDQALEFVNTFVRSFYLYHSQEITNSIINNYLTTSRSPAGKSSIHYRSRINKSPYMHQDDGAFNDRTYTNDNNTTVVQNAKLNQQLLILHSLLEAFHDALTVVPVLKATLIHATRQLDVIVDAFVGLQLDKWKKQSPVPSTTPTYKDRHLDGKKLILDSFVSFAQLLFNDPAWPLQLHSPQANLVLSQAKSTYFYQFDSSLLIKRVHKVIAQINGEGSSLSLSKVLIKKTLVDLADKLENNPNWRNKLGIDCALWGETNKNKRKKEQTLAETFISSICLRASSILAQFVISGRISSRSTTDDRKSSASSRELFLSSSSIEQFQSECIRSKESKSTSLEDHSSSIQSIASTETQNYPLLDSIPTQSCLERRDKLALIYLLEDLDNSVEDISNYHSTSNQKVENIWRIFNPFSQLKATLPYFQGHNQDELWKMSHIFSESDAAAAAADTKSDTTDLEQSLAARSSFWANFIPALNCTKTQPVIPSSLLLGGPLSLGGSSNSSLLTLNLLFSCQQGGISSLGVIESLANSAHSKLNLLIEQWTIMNNSLSSFPQQMKNSAVQQNHHSTRMANMSNKSAGYFELTGGNPQLDSSSNHESFASPSINSTSEFTSKDSFSLLNLHAKSGGLFLTLGGGLLITFALAIAIAFVVLKQQRKPANMPSKLDGRLLSAQQQAPTTTDPQETTSPGLDSTDLKPHHSSDHRERNTSVEAIKVSLDYHDANQAATHVSIQDNPVKLGSNSNYLYEHQDMDGDHICTLVDSNENNYTIYWGHEDINSQDNNNCYTGDFTDKDFHHQLHHHHIIDRNEGTLKPRQSHSILNVPDDATVGGAVYAATLASDSLNGIGVGGSIINLNTNEPILVPLQLLDNTVSSNSNHSATIERGVGRTSCLTNGLYTTLDSSSESTQVQSNKKRVKIHDPMGNPKQQRASRKQRHIPTTVKQRLNIDVNSLSNEPRNYCPMHGHEGDGLLDNSALDTQYYIDNVFVQANSNEDPGRICVGTGANYYHQHPSSMLDNYDYNENSSITRTTSFINTLNYPCPTHSATNSNTLQ